MSQTVKLIHVGCRELGIDGETRRAMQLQLVGKESLTAMTEAERKQVLTALKERGFKPFGNAKTGGPKFGGRGRPAAKRPDVRFAHVLWRLLVEAGEAKVAGSKGLNAFIRARFAKTWGFVPLDIDVMQEAAEIRDVVEALKDWCARKGVELDQ